MKKYLIIILMLIVLIGLNVNTAGLLRAEHVTAEASQEEESEGTEVIKNHEESSEDNENKSEDTRENKDEEKKIELPEYSLMGKFKSDTGLISADILVAAYTQDEPSNGKQEKVYLKIMDIEQIEIAYFYSTEEAFEANTSTSYTEKEVTALKNGFLGMVDKGGNYFDNEVFGF